MCDRLRRSGRRQIWSRREAVHRWSRSGGSRLRRLPWKAAVAAYARRSPRFTMFNDPPCRVAEGCGPPPARPRLGMESWLYGCSRCGLGGRRAHLPAGGRGRAVGGDGRRNRGTATLGLSSGKLELDAESTALREATRRTVSPLTRDIAARTQQLALFAGAELR